MCIKIGVLMSKRELIVIRVGVVPSTYGDVNSITIKNDILSQSSNLLGF